jgi:hypothetical protein
MQKLIENKKSEAKALISHSGIFHAALSINNQNFAH